MAEILYFKKDNMESYSEYEDGRKTNNFFVTILVSRPGRGREQARTVKDLASRISSQYIPDFFARNYA